MIEPSKRPPAALPSGRVSAARAAAAIPGPGGRGASGQRPQGHVDCGIQRDDPLRQVRHGSKVAGKTYGKAGGDAGAPVKFDELGEGVVTQRAMGGNQGGEVVVWRTGVCRGRDALHSDHGITPE